MLRVVSEKPKGLVARKGRSFKHDERVDKAGGDQCRRVLRVALFDSLVVCAMFGWVLGGALSLLVYAETFGVSF